MGYVTNVVTLGVPRLKEIVTVATSIKTPSFPTPELGESSTLAKNGEQELANMSLRTVIATVRTRHGPDST